MRSILSFMFLACLATSTYADDLEFALSSDSIEAGYTMHFSNNLSIELDWLHADIDGVKNADSGDPVSENVREDGVESDVLGFGMYANGETGPVRSYIGGKAFYLDTENGDGMHGIAAGGAVEWTAYPKLNIFGQLLYAPDILTGGEFDTMLDFNFRVSYELLPNASIFLGGRFVEVEFDTFNKLDREIHKGPFIGMKISI